MRIIQNYAPHMNKDNASRRRFETLAGNQAGDGAADLLALQLGQGGQTGQPARRQQGCLRWHRKRPSASPHGCTASLSQKRTALCQSRTQRCSKAITSACPCHSAWHSGSEARAYRFQPDQPQPAPSSRPRSRTRSQAGQNIARRQLL